MSPTYSQMINTISLSDEDFEINKDLLRKDFYSEVNKQRNDWFFSTIPKVIRAIYQEEFYAYLGQEKKNIKFWIWFELFKQEEYPDYPCKRVNNTRFGLPVIQLIRITPSLMNSLWNSRKIPKSIKILLIGLTKRLRIILLPL